MPTQPNAPDPAARETDPRACEYCGETLTYRGTDIDSDGDRVAEYWCNNCKEYLYFMVYTEPPPAAARRAGD